MYCSTLCMYGAVSYGVFYHRILGEDRGIYEYCGYWIWVLRINSVQPDIVSISTCVCIWHTFALRAQCPVTAKAHTCVQIHIVSLCVYMYMACDMLRVSTDLSADPKP